MCTVLYILSLIRLLCRVNEWNDQSQTSTERRVVLVACPAPHLHLSMSAKSGCQSSLSGHLNSGRAAAIGRTGIRPSLQPTCIPCSHYDRAVTVQASRNIPRMPSFRLRDVMSAQFHNPAKEDDVVTRRVVFKPHSKRRLILRC